MTTYRYRIIRRDIYEECSKQTPDQLRTFADMRKLFKKSYWVLAGVMIGCLIASTALLACFPGKIYGCIPLVIVLPLNIIRELWGYQMCDPSELQKEHEEVNASLESYVELIQNILHKHGITAKSERDTLKKECEQQISFHNKYYNSINSKIFDRLIGIPLGAVISALIYKSEGADITLISILVIVCIGLTIIGVANIIKQITFYSDGHFKDQYLLEVLNELEYLPE